MTGSVVLELQTVSRCLFVLLVFAAACAEPVVVTDAGAPAVVDAGAVADAGVVVAAIVDAGSAAIVNAGAPAVDTVVDAGSAGAQALPPPTIAVPKTFTSTVFDRMLIKPKQKGQSPDDVMALAARHGAKVESARRTAGSYVLVRFAPTSPPRGRAEQKALIEKLQKSRAFAVVEGDAVMTLK